MSRAGIASLRDAARDNLPTLATSMDASLVSSYTKARLKTLVRDLEPSDRFVLAAQTYSQLCEVVQYQVAGRDPYEGRDAGTVGLGEEILRREPVMKEITPALSWLVEHHQELKEQLPEIIIECAPWAPGPIAGICDVLEYYKKKVAKEDKGSKGDKGAAADSKQAAQQQRTRFANLRQINAAKRKWQRQAASDSASAGRAVSGRR